MVMFKGKSSFNGQGKEEKTQTRRRIFWPVQGAKVINVGFIKS